MQELGYTEGRNYDMVYRFADGHADRLQKLASELVQLNPDVIIAGASANAVAVESITSTLPVIVPALADAVAPGLIESEARPGGKGESRGRSCEIGNKFGDGGNLHAG